MVKSLKRKFIFTAMLVVTILLIGLVAALNIINYTSMNAQADKLLDELANRYVINPSTYLDTESQEIQSENTDETEHAQDFSENSDGDSNAESFGDSENAENTEHEASGFEVYNAPPIYFGFMVPDINGNTIMGAVYFTVAVNSEGITAGPDVSRVADVTEEEAKELALKLFAEKKASGWAGEYKYITTLDNLNNYVYVFLNRSTELNNHKRVLFLSIIIMLLCFLIFLILVCLLANKIIKPIAVNIENQKRFITDAGHEIKTPLAIIRANTEALELYEGENKWTKNIKDQVVRLSILLSNMLTLTKAEEGIQPGNISDVNLSLIAEEFARMFREPAEYKSIKIRYEVQPDLIVKGSKNQFGQLFSILMDNAVKYAPKETQIELTSEIKEKTIEIKIVNEIEKIYAEDPDLLFERFYRPDSTRYGENTGTGIGLSAARAIMEMYGGTITCSYIGDKHIAFTMTFKKVI